MQRVGGTARVLRGDAPRWLLLVCLTGLVAGLSGCHHEAARAYPPALAPHSPVMAGVSGGRVGEERGEEGTSSGMAEIPADGRLISNEVGLASWYGTVYNRQRSANGEVFDQDGMTAASRTIPLGAVARVTNLATGQVAVVRITDRGPFVPGRILDLSEGAAKAAGLYRMGVGQVRVEAFLPGDVVVGPARWCVQIGAFADPDDAQVMKNDLLRRYATAKVIAFKGPTGSWVRVTLPVPDRELSAQVAASVRVPDPGVEAYVTRLN